MENHNYAQLYSKLTKSVSPKIKNIFDRRFGVASGEPETLESIGKSLKITRERVRQIEEAGFSTIRKHHQDNLNAVFATFDEYFQNNGGFKREELVLEELGGKKQQSYVLFFLTIAEKYAKVSGKKDYHYYWAINKEAAHKAKETLHSILGYQVSLRSFPSSLAHQVGEQLPVVESAPKLG